MPNRDFGGGKLEDIPTDILKDIPDKKSDFCKGKCQVEFLGFDKKDNEILYCVSKNGCGRRID